MKKTIGFDYMINRNNEINSKKKGIVTGECDLLTDKLSFEDLMRYGLDNKKYVAICNGINLEYTVWKENGVLMDSTGIAQVSSEYFDLQFKEV